MIIIGAGLAGLLAAAMLRNRASTIFERQEALPNNHNALLRFRSSIVGDTLNIPFKKVQVIKVVEGGSGNLLRDSVSYALKTTGIATMRSLMRMRDDAEERYIAPPDLVEQMRAQVMCEITYDVEARLDWIKSAKQPIISTIPMHELMRVLEYPHNEVFRHIPGWTVTCTIDNCDIYGTIYYPGNEEMYRASITGNRLIIEYAYPYAPSAPEEVSIVAATNAITTILYDFGFGHNTPALINIRTHPGKYHKILPINDDERKRFILWATERFNVYSLGRFATWRPGLLLDDVVNDVRQIERMARSSHYELRKG